ncbi:hypothetical protein F4779DRAFT_613848 [Xylariaceae sp. FL0662B]|nr:hypothetical protein F4779DRAFT_613848 [Xylariaceae sp. FL0662B]
MSQKKSAEGDNTSPPTDTNGARRDEEIWEITKQTKQKKQKKQKNGITSRNPSPHPKANQTGRRKTAGADDFLFPDNVAVVQHAIEHGEWQFVSRIPRRPEHTRLRQLNAASRAARSPPPSRAPLVVCGSNSGGSSSSSSSSSYVAGGAGRRRGDAYYHYYTRLNATVGAGAHGAGFDGAGSGSGSGSGGPAVVHLPSWKAAAAEKRPTRHPLLGRSAARPPRFGQGNPYADAAGYF